MAGGGHRTPSLHFLKIVLGRGPLAGRGWPSNPDPKDPIRFSFENFKVMVKGLGVPPMHRFKILELGSCRHYR